MTFAWRPLAVVLVLAALSGCPAGPHGPGTTRGTPIQAPSLQPVPGAAPLHEGRPYVVSSRESLLTILAFKGGTLAKAGHNHVIASHDVAGTIYVPEDPSRATFEMRLPVAQLTIDERELRIREGTDFPPDVPDSAREGTRRNMLSAALLAGDEYPEIVLEQGTATASSGAAAASPGATAASPGATAASSGATAASSGATLASSGGARQISASVQMTVRGQPHTLTVPLTYELGDSQLVITGELSIRQNELGLTPFSALLGALQVQDEMRVKFRFVAHPAEVHRAPT